MRCREGEAGTLPAAGTQRSLGPHRNLWFRGLQRRRLVRVAGPVRGGAGGQAADALSRLLSAWPALLLGGHVGRGFFAVELPGELGAQPAAQPTDVLVGGQGEEDAGAAKAVGYFE
jgi:hypothetical protein